MTTDLTNGHRHSFDLVPVADGPQTAKEYKTERNNQIVFAVDSGRQMSEPVAGVPRIDRAVGATETVARG